MKNLIYITLALFLVSCQFSQPKGIKKNKETFLFQKGNCEEEACLDIKIEYVKLEGNEMGVRNINRSIEESIFSLMLLDEEQTYISKDSAVALRAADLDAFHKEFPGARTGGYIQESKVDLCLTGQKYLSFRGEHYQYNGGAHGMGFVKFLLFDKRSGNEINYKQLIADMPAFREMAEVKLRAKLGMESNDKWEDFTFLKEFTLPEQVGVCEQGFVLVYNPYELRSFADGKTELIIQFHELKMTAKDL